MDHQYHVCDDEHCNICIGGLATCVVCHGAEIDLTSECCGRPMTDEEHSRVPYELDYKDGEWINVKGTVK